MTIFSKKSLYLFLMTSLVLVLTAPALALDTDIYALNPRPNVAIQFDTSGSMRNGVFENEVDYRKVYKSACEHTFDGHLAYDKDNTNSLGGINNENYQKYIDPNGDCHDLGRNEIILIKGAPGLHVSGETTMVGDIGYCTGDWDYKNIIRTNTQIVDGELRPVDNAYPMLLHVNSADGVLYLNDEPLPLDRGIKFHDPHENNDGTVDDLGFAGVMQAPGIYFSGYSEVNPLITASSTDGYIYFLATGNRLFMLMAHQLFDNPNAGSWSFYSAEPHTILGHHTIPLQNDEIWHEETLVNPIQSPNYPDDYEDTGGNQKLGVINPPGATKIQLHFTDLALATNNANNLDRIIIKDRQTGNVLGVITYTSNSSTPFYSPIYTLEGTLGLKIVFHTNHPKWQNVGKGFRIDSYKYSTQGSSSGGYTMKNRLEVVREAILFVVDDTLGDINWALAGFGSDGADVKVHFTGVENDEAMLENIKNKLNAFTAYGGTPLGESMQDIFNEFNSADSHGYFSSCSRQFAILVTDGFPSGDTKWSRMNSGVTIKDYDNDGWTADPSQSSSYNYLDDVTGYMYTHSFRGSPWSVVADPETSFNNITSHTISFAIDLPLLTDTAEDGGGIALVAKSSQQLAKAIRSVAMMAIKSASYVAPVISVDTANKTQSGEWLYMAFFKPTSERWEGNLKKYKLVKKVKDGSCPNRTKEEWVVTDIFGDDSDALDCDGQFKTSSKSYWSSVVDGGEVTKGGVGEHLRTQVKDSFDNGTYYTGRNIYILRNEASSAFPAPEVFSANVTNADLGLGDTEDDNLERHKIINYIYGYTYTADATNSAPDAYRNWPLGSFIHSNPNLVTYENVTGGKTYIVIGSNDGMIHVFDDTTGDEVVAFIPEDCLSQLKEINPDKTATGYKDSPLFYIDGQTSYYQEFSSEGKSIPKQLIFSLRRGGSSYYSLNVENSDPSQWTLKWHLNSNSGGFSKMGQSWSKIELMPIRTGSGTETVAGVFGAGYDPEYDDTSTRESNDSNKPGAALYVIDILNSDATGVSLLKKVAYNLHDGPETDNMHYAIPANPAVVPDKYGRLKTIYFSDIGGQVWNLGYDSTTFAFDLKPRLIFQANPGSDADSGDKNGGSMDDSDIGRRMFYSPSITLMGGCNYRYSETCDYTDLDATNGAGSETCAWVTRDPDTYALVVGTGDRVNPNRKDINNRIYMILDTEIDEDSPTTLNETNLFNVTMDEIDIDSVDTNGNAISAEDKTSMRNYLSTTNGWYIKLEDIDDLDDYGEPVHHDGEKILAHPVIFNGVAYVPSFTPISDDECHPKGEAKVYALHYCDGTAGVNFFKANDDTSGEDSVAKFDYRDRYKTIGESLPSSPKIIIREGKAEVFISVGGGLPTIESKLGLKPIEIINWRELRN